MKRETILKLIANLKDATFRLESWIGTDCECDNTHAAVGRQCCLCEYRTVIADAEQELKETA